MQQQPRQHWYRGARGAGNAIDAAANADVVVIAVGSSSKGSLNGFTFYDTQEKEYVSRARGGTRLE